MKFKIAAGVGIAALALGLLAGPGISAQDPTQGDVPVQGRQPAQMADYSVTVVDADGKPVSGARVQAALVVQGMDDFGPARDTTDDSGKATVQFPANRALGQMCAIDPEGKRIGFATRPTSSEDRSFTITLQPAGWVSGSVTVPEVEGANPGRGLGTAMITTSVGEGDDAQTVQLYQARLNDGAFHAMLPEGTFRVVAGTSGTMDFGRLNAEITVDGSKLDEVQKLDAMTLPMSNIWNHWDKAPPKLEVTEARNMELENANWEHLKGKWVLVYYWAFW